jgi:hypothetical protein
LAARQFESSLQAIQSPTLEDLRDPFDIAILHHTPTQQPRQPRCSKNSCELVPHCDCNVRGLTLHDVRFEVATSDLRPAMVFDRVEDAAINGVSAQGNLAAESLLRFTNTRDLLLTSARVLTPAAAFLQLEGESNERIAIEGGDLSQAGTPVKISRGAAERAVKMRT